MLFNSYIFIFAFLPITLFFYYLLTEYKQYRFAIAWLTIASLFFYGWWNPKFLILLLTSIIINYAIGFTLWRRAQNKLSTKIPLMVGVGINLALIAYYKYAFFLITNLNYFAGVQVNADQIILPLAISFFTFQQIGFLIDASRGEVKEYRFIDYCLFISFFPQLIAGPIVQHKQLIPQFEQNALSPVKSENISIGLTIFFIGLFKKIALADSVSVYANVVFNALGQGVELSFWEAWAGALAYSLQLYFDFSGYSDMAVGVGYLFGIKLPINFNSPYKAVNIIEFWRRWHITLSTFLRDYLYISLGGNRKGNIKRYSNLFITMLLGGLWHGANWTFVLWGALHGSYLIINHFWRWLCGANPFFAIFRGKWFKPISHIITMIAIITAWVPFRAQTVTQAGNMLNSMFSINAITMPNRLKERFIWLNDITANLGIQYKGLFPNNLVDWRMGIALILILLLIAMGMPNTNQFMHKYFPYNGTDNFKAVKNNILLWQPSVTWAWGMALFILVTIMLISEKSEFLYFQF
jgi:D-alanyl-lipoteichoic acid acyltransferase DltB (MBOAT superfamily)